MRRVPHDVLLVDYHKLMRDGIRAILERDSEFRHYVTRYHDVEEMPQALPPERSMIARQSASLPAPPRAIVTSMAHPDGTAKKAK